MVFKRRQHPTPWDSDFIGLGWGAGIGICQVPPGESEGHEGWEYRFKRNIKCYLKPVVKLRKLDSLNFSTSSYPWKQVYKKRIYNHRHRHTQSEGLRASYVFSLAIILQQGNLLWLAGKDVSSLVPGSKKPCPAQSSPWPKRSSI